MLAMANPHMCAWCLDVKAPVERQNGHSVKLGEAREVQIELYLHCQCAHSWSQEFGTALPLEFRLTYCNYN
jgi:hypothetical protein